MKKATIYLAFIMILCGVCLSGCSIQRKTEPKKSQLIIENKQLQKKNTELNNQLKDVAAELNTLKAELLKPRAKGKYPGEIDELLNIEDASIFTNNFKLYELSSVHPRSRNMYQWVKNIHELGEQLMQIEKDHQTIDKFNEDIANMPPQTIEQLKSLNTAIKDNIRAADKLRQDIDVSYSEMKMAFTSAQMNYYRDLVGKLNNFINIYFE